MIHTEQIQDITSRIITNFDPDKIILFGSYAKGNFNDDSDLDLIIIKNSELPKHQRGLEIRRLFYGLTIPMDLKIYTPMEYDQELQNKYSFIFSIIQDSKILYERKA